MDLQARVDRYGFDARLKTIAEMAIVSITICRIIGILTHYSE